MQLGDHELARDPEQEILRHSQSRRRSSVRDRRTPLNSRRQSHREQDRRADDRGDAGSPLYLPAEQDWINAGDLQVGDWLQSTPAQKATVSVGEVREYATSARVYNLTVANLHTYYVLAAGVPVLVHNCGGLLVKNGPEPEKVHTVLNRIHEKNAPLNGYKGGKPFNNDGSQGASILPRGGA